jgi:hypothetical protein
MGKTHSKPLAARHDMETAWARHDMCESALREFRVLRPSVLWSAWNSKTQTEILMSVIYTLYRAMRLLLLTYDPQVFNYAIFEFIHDFGAVITTVAGI